MISLAIQRAAMVTSEAISRKINPKETTTGPDSQTILSTGGKLCSAERRSRHPLQKVSRSVFMNVQKCGDQMPELFLGFNSADMA
jgi:hypothetical protein